LTNKWNKVFGCRFDVQGSITGKVRSTAHTHPFSVHKYHPSPYPPRTKQHPIATDHKLSPPSGSVIQNKCHLTQRTLFTGGVWPYSGNNWTFFTLTNNNSRCRNSNINTFLRVPWRIGKMRQKL
jgi:hypothetical protein